MWFCRNRRAGSHHWYMYMYDGMWHECDQLSTINRLLVEAVKDFCFRFFQKHHIWQICWPSHIFSISGGRQDEWPLGPLYWRNPIWPPLGLEINCSEKTKRHRIMSDTTFMGCFGSWNLILMLFKWLESMLPLNVALNNGVIILSVSVIYYPYIYKHSLI